MLSCDDLWYVFFFKNSLITSILLFVSTSGENTDQLLGVARLASGTGIAGANGTIEILERWRIEHLPKYIAFDTCRVMTGINTGMCVEIERKLGRFLLWLACRHHISEILLKECVTYVLKEVSNSPEVPILKDFKRMWEGLDHDESQEVNFGTEDKRFKKVFREKDEIVTFLNSQLSQHMVRNDYKELCQVNC